MEESDEDISFEEVAETNDMYIDVLIELLKAKGIITQEEFDKKLDEMYPDEE